MSDYTSVWKVLNSGMHVLLFVDVADDDPEMRILRFQRRVEDIREWFKSIVKEDWGGSAFLMQNDALLVVRMLSNLPVYPFDPEKEGVKLMVLRDE